METIRRSDQINQKIEGERRESLPRIAALVIEDERGRLLCQQRPFGIRHGGKWTVTAGGHQERGESDDGTVWRETMEEIGLEPLSGTRKSLEIFFPGNESARASSLQFYTKRIRAAALPELSLDPRCVAAMDWLPPEELLQNPDGLQPEFFEYLKAWEMVRTAEFGVIFDMDDTMFHSKPHVLPTFRHAVRRLTGIEISDALLSQHHGKTTEQFAAYLEQELHVPVPAKEFNELLDVFEDSLHRSREVKPFRGFVQLMDQLEQVGIPIAVGTSSGRRRAERILRQLNSRERMLAVVTSEDVERHKPYPDVFLEAASRLGLPPERCIVVEDSFGGLQAARAGGMVPIANDMGYHTDAELRIAHHVVTQYDMLTVDRLTELVKRHV